MAAPTRIYDISTTAASNSPTGSESVGTSLDDYLRAIQTVYRLDLASKGLDIASATSTDLGAIGGLMHDITGTTTITGFGTVAAGVWKIIKFEDALTLTHNATSLILPGAANITTANGDTALMISEGSGNWRCVSYVRAAVAPLVAQGLVKLESGTASDDATLDISMTSYTAYKNKLLVLTSFIPATDGAGLYVRLSTDGGSNFDAGSNYRYTNNGLASNAASASASDDSDTEIEITGNTGVGSGTGESCNVELRIFDTTNTATHTLLKWTTVTYTGELVVTVEGSGVQTTAQDVDAIRLLFSSGNIESGTWVLYGYN